HQRYDTVANTWASLAAVPVPIWQPGTGTIDGKNYIYGGGNISLAPGDKPAHATKSNGKAPLAYTSTYIYDIASNSWTTGPNMNSPHSWTGGTNVGNRLIVVGGFNGSTGDTNIVEMSIVPVRSEERRVGKEWV